MTPSKLYLYCALLLIGSCGSSDEPQEDAMPPAPSVCGDGVVQADESCDDGVNDGTYGHCSADCLDSPAEYCGDGTLNGPELCDDGNPADDDTCVSSCAAFGPGVAVFLLAGQSNMDGLGIVSELPEPLWPYDGSRLFYDGALGDLAPASTQGPDRFGPEIGFARAMVDGTSVPNVILIKYAADGTTLAVDWDPGATPSDPRGPSYQAFLDAVTSGLAAIRAQGEEPVITGMIWMQGETDGSFESFADAYEANLIEFIARCREDLAAPDMPFVIGKIHDPNRPFRDTIRAAQEAADGSVENTGIVETDDLGLLSDLVHYDTPSMVTLGERFANTLLAVLSDR